MVFSNEAMLKMKNLESIGPRDNIDSMMLEEEISNLYKNKDKIVNEYLDDYFYGPDNSELVGGKDVLDRIIYSTHMAFIMSHPDFKRQIDEYFDKQLEKYKDELYNHWEDYAITDKLTLNPENAITDVKLKLLVENMEKNASFKFATGLIFKHSKEAANYIKEHEKESRRFFSGYKKDILDKTHNTQDKIAKLLGFLYIQMGANAGYLEQDAVHYFIELTRFDAIALSQPTEFGVTQERRNAKRWLKAHNKAKTFLDLMKDNAENYDDINTILSVLALLGVPYFALEANKDLPVIDQETIQKLLFVLDFNDSLSEDQKTKDMLLYFIYAIYPIINQGKLYSKEYMKARFKLEIANYKHKEEIDKLKAASSPLEDIISEKQDKLNKAQLELDKIKRSKDKEIAKLQADIAKLKEANDKLAADNKMLSDLNNELSNRLDEVDIDNSESDNNIEDLLPNSYVQDKLKDKNIIIMGGHQIWQNKLKELYPYFTYIDADNVNYNINLTRNADIILFNTLHCSHTLYYRVKNNTNNGRIDNKNKLVYIGSNNLNYFRDIITNLVLDKK